MLEFDPAGGEFQKDAHQPLTGDLFVLDEVSLVDVVLAHLFLRAVPDDSCVVLVGDVDQLPSVGSGTVLSDLIESKRVPVMRLTQVFRQAEQSRIIQAAYAVNEGQMPRLDARKNALTDFYFLECDEPEQIQQKIVRLVRDHIPRRLGFDPLADIQVLTPMRTAVSKGMRNLLEFTEADLPLPKSEPEQIAEAVIAMFDGQSPVRTLDVANALGRNYGTVKTHLHRAERGDPGRGLACGFAPPIRRAVFSAVL